MIHPAYVQIDLVDDSVEIYEYPALVELINSGVKVTTITKKEGIIEQIHEWWPGTQVKRVMFSQEVHQ